MAAPCFVPGYPTPGLSDSRSGRFLARLFHLLACPVELEDDRVFHQPVDGRHVGHRILENLILLAEDQVGIDQQTPPFIAFSE